VSFTPLEWVVLAVAALAAGATKTAMPALGTIPAALFAAVLPAKESTGAVLGLLLLGDVIAVSIYHSHADWAALRRLLPSVLAGVLLGVVVLALADDAGVKRIIGATLVVLALLGIALLVRRRRSGGTPPAVRPGLAHFFGPLGGFTTMVANAAGPVMSLYFVAARFPVGALLGTAAWFFLLVNAIKLPFSVGLGLITPQSLLTNLLLVPALVVGALLGRVAVRRISPLWFERIVLALTLVSGVYLLL
jgi:uncharacterized protein